MNIEELFSRSTPNDNQIKMMAPLFKLLMAIGLCAKIDPKELAGMLADDKLIESYSCTFTKEHMKSANEHLAEKIDDNTKEKLVDLKSKLDDLLNRIK